MTRGKNIPPKSNTEPCRERSAQLLGANGSAIGRRNGSVCVWLGPRVWQAFRLILLTFTTSIITFITLVSLSH